MIMNQQIFVQVNAFVKFNLIIFFKNDKLMKRHEKNIFKNKSLH